MDNLVSIIGFSGDAYTVFALCVCEIELIPKFDPFCEGLFSYFWRFVNVEIIDFHFSST